MYNLKPFDDLNNIGKRFYSIYEANSKKITVISRYDSGLVGIILISHTGGANFYICFYCRENIREITKSGTTGSFNLSEVNKFVYTVNLPYWSFSFLSLYPSDIELV